MILLDTHALMWLLEGNERLGIEARRGIAEAAGEGAVCVSAITPWEISLLARKGRINLGRDTRSWIDTALALPGIMLVPIEPRIAIDSNDLPGSFHSDPADRLLVATARFLGIPLLTSDRAILRYGAQGHVGVVDASL